MSDRPPILMMPGASLLTITATDERVTLKCPECKQKMVMTAVEINQRGTEERLFPHRERCSIGRRVAVALALARPVSDAVN